MVVLHQGAKALFIIETFRGIFKKEFLLHMYNILQDIYYVICMISILCGASYKIGYEIGKNTRE